MICSLSTAFPLTDDAIDDLIYLVRVLCSQKDGTLQTTSSLAFTASVYDNGRTFKCYAENSVTRSEDMKPMIESITIEVLCKWTIILDVSVPAYRHNELSFPFWLPRRGRIKCSSDDFYASPFSIESFKGGNSLSIYKRNAIRHSIKV